MEAQEATMHGSGESRPRRVVEYELRMPRIEDIRLPRLPLEPWRSAAEEVAVTTLGVGVLIARSLRRAIEITHEAGVQSSQQPGTLSHTLVEWLRPRPASAEHPHTAQVLAIEDYDRLSPDEIVRRCPA